MIRPPKELLDGRRRILDAAAEVFARSGFAGARVDEIAARAGLNKAMVYYYIGGKETLYATMISELFERIIDSLESAVETVETPEGRIRAVVRTIGETVEHNPHLPPIMLREIATGGRSLPPEVLRKMKELFAVVWRILDEGADAGLFRKTDPVITQMLIGGSMMLLVAGTPVRERIRALRREEDGVRSPPEDLVGEVTELLLHGIVAVPDPAARIKSGRKAPRSSSKRKSR